MDLPAVYVGSLSALQGLAVAEDPREIVVTAIDAVRNAPEYLVLVAQKIDMGWTCGQEARIRKVVRFAEHLFEIGDVVIPALENDPSNIAMVRRLGYHGKRIRSIGSRTKPHTPLALVRLARPLGNTLRDASRLVIKEEQLPEWLADRLDTIAAQIEMSLDSNVDMEALRTVRLAGFADLLELADVDDDDPRDIRVIAVDAVRNAPDYLDLVLQKTGVGWRCDQEARLRKVARFATLLTEISEFIVPALKVNVANKAAIRRLRTRGEQILRLKSRAPAAVVALAGPLANRIIPAARSVLTGANEPEWLAHRLDDIGAQVQKCLNAHIDMEDEEPKDEDQEPHQLPPPHNNM
ncbi:hypothetical protein ACP70R_011461 [Stipagrostis hirtigluma subsp. patula]